MDGLKGLEKYGATGYDQLDAINEISNHETGIARVACLDKILALAKKDSLKIIPKSIIEKLDQQRIENLQDYVDGELRGKKNFIKYLKEKYDDGLAETMGEEIYEEVLEAEEYLLENLWNMLNKGSSNKISTLDIQMYQHKLKKELGLYDEIVMLKPILKKASLSIPKELHDKTTVGDMEINKPYFTYGLSQYCSYLLYIKNMQDEDNYLNMFYVFENDDKTLTYRETPDCETFYTRVNLDSGLSSNKVCTLFSPKRTLEEMTDILYDLDHLYQHNEITFNSRNIEPLR